MSEDQAAADLGAKLRDARAGRGLSLDQIASATKISIGVLEALESNDLSRVPAGVYGRGFVRLFANEVGLDPETAVAEFVAQSPPDAATTAPPIPEEMEKDEAPETHRRRRGSTVWRFTAVVVPMAAFVYLAAKGRWRERVGVPPSVNVLASQVVPDTPAAAAVPESLTLMPPPPPPVDRPSIATAPRAADVPRAAEVPRAADAAPAETDSVAVTRGEGLVPVERIPDPKVTEPRPTRLEVTLSVTRASWVIAVVDGKKRFSRLLEVGEQEMLDVRQDLVLTAGDAGAVVMTLNGAEARPLGQAGETVTAHVNRANFKSYLMPGGNGFAPLNPQP